ncbi:DinB family protein [Cesiribacter andamanensis]|uniref:DinB superfamily protein n=1 Tax=Cesiribacter andamanensis AMV16 TaxID=1279009 RepID=M7N077_9BACT|nr:DinB family protein [Cesiribacter andamanensis]EMR02098.1 DinB superfamily protein [Cesiribacter andamanensis AMV16]
MQESQRIADQLKRSMEGEAWHGPALLELLADVSAPEAAAHPLPVAHSIWELCLHLNCWQVAVLQRLQGQAMEYAPDEDWPTPPAPTEAAWQQALEQLQYTYRQLQAAILQLPDEQLEQPCPGKNYSLYILLHGLIQHILYHGGQIALLRKALQV